MIGLILLKSGMKQNFPREAFYSQLNDVEISEEDK